MRSFDRALCVGLLVITLGCQSPATPPRAPSPAAGSLTATPDWAAGGSAASSSTSSTTSAKPAPLDPPVTVRVGLLSSISDSGVYIGLERGYYHELGLDLQVETISDPNT